MGNRSGKLAEGRSMNSKEDNKFDASLSISENIKTTGFTQAQTPVKNYLPVFVSLRQQLNIQHSSSIGKDNQDIDDCIKIGNTFVFTDWKHRQLTIYNVARTGIDRIPLRYAPYYITSIDCYTVAVSCTYYKTILIINLSGSVTSSIETSGYCHGISYNDNNLYVVIGVSIIHMIDMTGKVIRTIPPPSYHIHDITVDRDRLVFINNTSIYCCSLDGKQMWNFKNDKFQDLYRVKTDDERNVYVTDRIKNDVVVISDDGNHHRELLSESDGLYMPLGIYFDKKENILLACNVNDRKVLFST
ncbi:unnamed protein product [Mytilus coruscus]|uniref:TRIM2_3 n=1 Tax=Mytilus coruscus TaxID=42192 RepID=A0A6J8EM02_MYTCO|nr:unnamed protein product [Mytilus coruscus]